MTLYATLAQVKSALYIQDAVSDAQITMAGEAASEAIDAYCGRSFGTVTTTRYYAPTNWYRCEVDDLAGTAITIQSSSAADGVYDRTWTVDEYQLEPLNGLNEGLPWPYTRIRAIKSALFPMTDYEATVRVTGVFGWASIPASIKQAALLQTIRWFKRPEAAFGVAGVGDMGVIRVTRSIDPDVAVLLEPYRRNVVGIA